MKNKKVIVAKFGGTSLACAENIRLVAEIIKSDPARNIIIVSAPGKRTRADIKVTDLLLGKHIELVMERFRDITDELGVDVDLAFDYENRLPDYVGSRGEYLMAKIMAAYLGFKFVEIGSGVRFETNTVIPGFYVVDKNGVVKTLGRGGSDVSGAIVADKVNADVYENWTDVDGIFDRDPNRHADAMLHEKLTYDEAREIINRGARVLHPRTLQFVEPKNIPIHIKNTFNPTGKGTIIG
ncbi:MAG: hypothetical protein FWE38_00250 [Firmicutes bacterium]|nr:hypothetical protein [Bacillota bacterium]